MAHLTLATLNDYAVGRLDEPEFGEASDHLEYCPDCRDRLFALEASNDELVAQLRGAGEKPKFVEEPEMASALAAARKVFSAGADVDTAARSAAANDAADVFSGIADYQVIEKIGQGGMGVVYAARHTKLDRPVAVKVLRSDRLARADSNARFMQELRAIGKLDHPNIVRAYDAREADGQHFLVMELVKGIDLSALVDAEGVLPVADACELVRQAAIGLQHAHEHNLVHRDVKPSNLMLSPGGVVKLLDLGLSRLHADKIRSGWDAPASIGSSSDTDKLEQSRELTESQQIIGSIDYMAPEQCLDGRSADARSDVYGLGATLFKLLTGRAPYASREFDTMGKKLAAIGGPAPTPMKINRSDLPSGLVVILARMLDKSQDARFQTAGEVAEALAPYSRGHNVQRFVGELQTAAGQPRDKESSHAKAAAGGRRSFGGWRGAVVAAACFAALAFGVVLLQLRTPHGELVVEVPPEARDRVKVKVQNEDEVHVVDADAGWSIQLKEGTWQVQLSDQSEQFHLDRNVATISREETEIVRVTLKPNVTGAAGQTTQAASEDSWQNFECKVYTQKYDVPADGTIRLSRLSWRVMPRYLGIVSDGQVIDDRLTIALVDQTYSFWPVIMKMSPEEGERLRNALADVLANSSASTDGAPSGDSTDCTIVTKPYKFEAKGAITLPAAVHWKVAAEYVNVRPEGRFIENRPTLLIEDPEHGVTSVAVRMPVAVAKSLLDNLSNVMAQIAGAEQTEKAATTESKQPPKVATLKTREGFYVRAVKGGGDDVVADAREPRTSEQFTFEWLDGNKRVRIRTREGFYLHPELGGGGDLDAEIREPGTSEVFEVEWLDETFSRLRLKTREGFYVRAVQGGGGDVVADVKEPGTSEVFTLTPIEKVWFRSPNGESSNRETPAIQ
jgi:serine/threonine protein kinase